MMKRGEEKMGNGICHIEIPVTDLKKAKEFYSKLFGWTVPFIDEKTGYALFDAGTPPNGGFNKVAKVTPSQIQIYIMVDDIEKKLQEIKTQAAKQLKKPQRFRVSVGKQNSQTSSATCWGCLSL